MIPTENQSAVTVAEKFVKHAVCIFGSPKTLLTDFGTNLQSQWFEEMSKLFKIKDVCTTAYRPQSNGSIERSNTKLNEFLRLYTNKELEWDEWIEFAAFSYNTSKHSSTNLTPFEVLFGKEARMPYVKKSKNELSVCKYMEDLVTKLDKVYSYAYEYLLRYKERNK